MLLLCSTSVVNDTNALLVAESEQQAKRVSLLASLPSHPRTTIRRMIHYRARSIAEQARDDYGSAHSLVMLPSSTVSIP